MLESNSSRPAGRRFPTTRWSQVHAAGHPSSPGAREALVDLCEAYWYPLYAFSRSHGHDSVEAGDLVQGYFVRVLESGVLAAADPEKGRFRTFLIADCMRYLSNQHVRDLAQKRGGGRPLASFDAAKAE